MAVIKQNRFPVMLKTNTGLPLPAVARSTDANVLRMSTNRFHCQLTLQGGSVGRMPSHPLPHHP
jgi:hypothetical protein